VVSYFFIVVVLFQVRSAFHWREHELGPVVWPSSRYTFPLSPRMGRTCSPRALHVSVSEPALQTQYWVGPPLGCLLATVLYLILKQYALPSLFHLTSDRP
jgi:hypothetical protein